MVCFRLIKPDEVEEAERLFSEKYPWAALPNWKSTFVRVQDGKLTGLVDIQQRITVGNLVAFDDSVLTTIGLIERVDQSLQQFQEYEFIVPNDNENFQKFLLEKYGLEGEVEVPHKLYRVIREVEPGAGGQTEKKKEEGIKQIRT